LDDLYKEKVVDVFSMSTTLIDEIRYADVIAKQSSINKLFPTFDDRVKAVAGKGGVRLKQVRGDLWTFKVHSGTKDGVWYTNNVKFPNLEEDIRKYAKDKKLWNKDGTKVDLRKLAVEILFSTDVQLYCSCPAFLYYGAAYILTQRGAKYTKPENRPPKKRNPSELGAICKHGQLLLDVLPMYATTLSKYISQYYGDVIEDTENEVKGKKNV